MVTVIVTVAVMEVVHRGPPGALAMVLSPRWCCRPAACCPNLERPVPALSVLVLGVLTLNVLHLCPGWYIS
jgi:hypothetical protein